MKTLRTQRRSGFTLLETLVGTGVLAVGIVGAVGMQQWATQATATSGRVASAGAVGQAKLEHLLQAGFENVTSGTATDAQYDLAWTMTTESGYKKVLMEVGWESVSGMRRKVIMSNMIAEVPNTPVLPGFALPGRGGNGGIPMGIGNPGDTGDSGGDDSGDSGSNGKGNGKGNGKNK